MAAAAAATPRGRAHGAQLRGGGRYGAAAARGAALVWCARGGADHCGQAGARGTRWVRAARAQRRSARATNLALRAAFGASRACGPACGLERPSGSPSRGQGPLGRRSNRRGRPDRAGRRTPAAALPGRSLRSAAGDRREAAARLLARALPPHAARGAGPSSARVRGGRAAAHGWGSGLLGAGSPNGAGRRRAAAHMAHGTATRGAVSARVEFGGRPDKRARGSRPQARAPALEGPSDAARRPKGTSRPARAARPARGVPRTAAPGARHTQPSRWQLSLT